MIAFCLLLTACQAEQAPVDDGRSVPAAVQSAPAGRPVLQLPVACRIGTGCEIQNYMDRDPGPGARDYRCGSSTYDDHSGLDIRLPDMRAVEAGVAVLAAASGRVARVRDGVEDVSVRTVGAAAVEGAECGNGVVIDHGEGWTTQYCHLRRGSVSVAPGDPVGAGQPIAQVGLSGNTEYAHLHLTVRHDGDVIDPFAPEDDASESCASAAGLWSPEAARALAYRAGVVLNAGFSDGPVDMAQVEEGTVTPASDVSRPLVAYVRAIGLKVGDVQTLRVIGPDGNTVAETTSEPLPRDQAQRLLFVGRRPPSGRWPAGRYVADYSVRRDGAVAVERRFERAL